MRATLAMAVLGALLLSGWLLRSPHPPAVAPPAIRRDYTQPAHATIAPPIAELHDTGSEHHDAEARAHAHPHGNQMCASGCTLSNHPTPALRSNEFEELLTAFVTAADWRKCKALDALVYYGPQAGRLLDGESSVSVPADRLEFLRRELTRTHVFVSLRLHDREGSTRALLPDTRVPLDIRHEYRVDVDGLKPLVASGTVKRVGLHHLWTRM